MKFNLEPKETKIPADINGFINGRDKDGRFLPGNSGGPGRPPGAVNKYTQIRQDILDIWHEEQGKERFRYLFLHEFERALAIILTLCPKKWLELKKDLSSGQVTLKAEETIIE